MFEFPKLVFLVLLASAIWIVYRWVNNPSRRLPRRPSRRPRPAIAAEDLVACGVCGAYVAARAPGCTRADCPQPR